MVERAKNEELDYMMKSLKFVKNCGNCKNRIIVKRIEVAEPSHKEYVCTIFHLLYKMDWWADTPQNHICKFHVLSNSFKWHVKFLKSIKASISKREKVA